MATRRRIVIPSFGDRTAPTQSQEGRGALRSPGWGVKVAGVELPSSLPAREMTAEGRQVILEVALRRMCTAGSCYRGDPLDDAYTDAGGGYEGLQAMAAKALQLAGLDRRTSPSAHQIYCRLTGGR